MAVKTSIQIRRHDHRQIPGGGRQLIRYLYNRTTRLATLQEDSLELDWGPTGRSSFQGLVWEGTKAKFPDSESARRKEEDGTGLSDTHNGLE
jgi:hypothetical protein